MSSPQNQLAENNEEHNEEHNNETVEPLVRLTYLEEKQRVVTIAYQVYNDPAGTRVKFAASIFRKPTEKTEKQKDAVVRKQDVFVRKQHAHTARERLILRPLWTEFDMEKHLRKEIHRRGVKSKKRVSNPETKLLHQQDDSENSSINLSELGRDEPTSVAQDSVAAETRQEHRDDMTRSRGTPANSRFATKTSGGSASSVGSVGLPGYYERHHAIAV